MSNEAQMEIVPMTGALHDAVVEAKRAHGVSPDEPVPLTALAAWLPDNLRQELWDAAIEHHLSALEAVLDLREGGSADEQ